MKTPDPELIKTLGESDFLNKIRNNDRVLHEIAGFQDFMLEKGYVNPDGTRSSGIMNMMKMISDKEVGKRLEGREYKHDSNAWSQNVVLCHIRSS